MSTKKKLTYDDYAALPEDGRRHELLAGQLHLIQSPSRPHQRVNGRLFRQLAPFFEEAELGEAFVAPFDVILSDHDIAEPDIVVVCDDSQFSARGVEGPPALVVEVLSPSSGTYDRVTKAARYLALGVEHYWIVDPEARRLVCQRAAHGSWVVAAEGSGDETVCDPAWPDLVIDLDRLW